MEGARGQCPRSSPGVQREEAQASSRASVTPTYDFGQDGGYQAWSSAEPFCGHSRRKGGPWARGREAAARPARRSGMMDQPTPRLVISADWL